MRQALLLYKEQYCGLVGGGTVLWRETTQLMATEAFLQTWLLSNGSGETLRLSSPIKGSDSMYPIISLLPKHRAPAVACCPLFLPISCNSLYIDINPDFSV